MDQEKKSEIESKEQSIWQITEQHGPHSEKACLLETE